MKHKPQGFHRRWGSAALVVGSAVAVMASPLATGAASAAATTQHYAATLSASVTTSNPRTVGNTITVRAHTTDGNFTTPSGPGGDVDNGTITTIATSGPVNGIGCQSPGFTYAHGTANYDCNFFSNTAGTSHVVITYTSNNVDIPDLTASIDITWTADNATHLVVSGPTSATLPDSGQTYTITAEDQYGNTDTGFPGGGTCLVDVTNSDGTVSSPLNLSSGVGTVTAAFTNPGTGTLTAATDTPGICALASGGVVANGSENVTVSSGPATVDHFDLSLSPSSTVTAGTSVGLHITARTADGSIATGDNGNVNVTGCASGSVTLAAGQATFTHTFNTATTCNYNVSDGTHSGGPIQLTVVAGTASQLVLTAPGTATAGTPVNVHVVAEDSLGNEATTYNGTVHFTSNDGSAVLPANTQLVNGETTVPVTFETAGSRNVTATDVNTGSINGTSNNVTVGAAGPDHLSVTASPGTVTAGQSVTVDVTVLDQFGNASTGDSGDCVSYSTVDSASSCVTHISGSTASFNVAFFTAGTQHVHIGAGGLAADSNNVTVVAAAANHLVVSAQSTAHRGTAIPVTVTAEDQWGNVATSDTGSLSFASNDANAVLPANGSVSLSGGTATFDVTFFRHATNDAVRVFDSHGNEGQSNPVNVI